MSDAVILFKAKRFMTGSHLSNMHDLFKRQIKEGCVVVPYDWEFDVVNPEQLECEIKVEDVDDRKTKRNN